MFEQLISCLKDIPNVVWSGIVASCITLLGVMLSNGSNTKRLKLQLDHDAREKSKDKINNLRKEVYLKVIEDIEATNIHMSTLVNRDLVNSNMTAEIQAITASIAKLKLVSEPETARLAGELSAAFGALFLRLIPRLMPVMEARSDIEINDSAYVNSSAEASRVMRDLHKFNEEGRQDAVIFQALQSNYDFFSAQAQQYASARALAYTVRNIRVNEFNAMLLPEMKELSKLQLKVAIAIRKDLGVSFNVADLERQLERHWAVMEAEFGNAMSGLKNE
ncbi:hypothetical protein LOY55_06570 [Pseudomonas sp. B21-040]|uniref:hypothetical protein n=1 Tax=Pseudomonas sp. B21-040 TaxID=2895486 RepID=UPI002160957D|nr:hypothetical protein [Pseudomonas sp. B21-040]UVL41764.1 hypothetical protein LOY55_06570 [Pseudomonas sp. B21-040]